MKQTVDEIATLSLAVKTRLDCTILVIKQHFCAA